MALHTWKECVYNAIHERLVRDMLSLIQTSRETGVLPFEEGDLLVQTVGTFMELGLNKQDPLKLYREAFEVAFVRVR